MLSNGKTIICPICGNSKYYNKSQLEGGSKYCSKPCYYKSKEGKSSWNKGVVGFMAGNKNVNWKEKPDYESLHGWVRYHKKKPSKCERCGVSGKRLEWANLSHEYKRDVDDYKAFCNKCHKEYDKDTYGITRLLFPNNPRFGILNSF